MLQEVMLVFLYLTVGNAVQVGGGMEIYIDCPTSQDYDRLTLKVLPTDTQLDLQIKISDALDVDIGLQNLVFNDKPLPSNQHLTLADLNIHSGTPISIFFSPGRTNLHFHRFCHCYTFSIIFIFCPRGPGGPK